MKRCGDSRIVPSLRLTKTRSAVSASAARSVDSTVSPEMHRMLERGPVPAVPASWKNDVIVVVVGLALYVVFVLWAHAWLFGVAPFPM